MGVPETPKVRLSNILMQISSVGISSRLGREPGLSATALRRKGSRMPLAFSRQAFRTRAFTYVTADNLSSRETEPLVLPHYQLICVFLSIIVGHTRFVISLVDPQLRYFLCLRGYLSLV